MDEVHTETGVNSANVREGDKSAREYGWMAPNLNKRARGETVAIAVVAALAVSAIGLIAILWSHAMQVDARIQALEQKEAK